MVLEKALEVVNPLDLRALFMNEIIGFDEQGIIIFMILGIAMIGFLCAKFRVPNIVFMMLSFCFLIIMGADVHPALTVALLIVGLLVSWMYQKYFGRG